MSTPDIVARATAYAAAVKEHDVYATHDPQKAAANRPCVLVALPTLDWRRGRLDGTPGASWRFIALAGNDTATVDAVRQLQKLVAAVDATFDIETATPTRYPVGKDQVPAYVMTITDPE